ncbi:glycerol-3-phosphate dehydrogenase [Desulforhopalus sp. 52FAK]
MQDKAFDVAVVGAGIHGATIALEAVKAGFSVVILEKADFGHSTSANSLKIVHGGIRYLQHGDLKRMRESITSRRSMMQFAPHLVKPLACLMPTYGHGIKGRETMRLAFGMYDLVAWDRNAGLAKENKLPSGHSIDTTEVRWAVPGVNETGLTGGAVWYDAIADDTERLILEYIKEAVRYGAVALNYTEVVEVKSENGQVSGLVARDKLGESAPVSITCKRVINAAGPWLAEQARGNAELGRQQWASAVNIVVKKRLFKKYAVGLEGYTDFKDKDAIIQRGKRLFFFVPWQEKYTMVGTTYKPFTGNADDLSLGREELQDFVDDINKVYPAGNLSLSDITYYHAGLLPMDGADSSEKDSVQVNKSSEIIDHGGNDSVEGLFSIKGVKYTTAPAIALDMVKILCKQDDKDARERGVYVSDPPLNLDYAPAIQRLGDEYHNITDHLKNKYGRDWRAVFKYIVGHSDNAENRADWLSLDPPMLHAELLYFISDEMAVTLLDVIIRRSNVGAAELPDSRVLSDITDAMAAHLNWTDDEKSRQLSRVEQFYSPVTGG